ncbi:MAG: RecX family transcriptional regulator [Thermoleophilia bacterium]|nr:RecX family transcriptional regulator [Thermoleophilia bacterium]MDH5280431.1 RecX family transcriptional regulator [Thermoleophilia bacterium]
MGVDAKTGDAYECALRALHHRDRTEFEIQEHLQARGFSEDDYSQAVVTLRRNGLVDDERFAQSRASFLVERGAGNALIRARLGEAGVARELVDGALEAVEGEIARARRIVGRRGASPKTARYLYGKGFSHGVIAAVIAEDDGGELR